MTTFYIVKMQSFMLRKKKNCNQNCLICVFLNGNWIKLLSYLKPTPSYSLKCKVHIQGKKNLGPKLSYLGIFGLEFEKTIVIFEIVHLNLSKCKLYLKKNWE